MTGEAAIGATIEAGLGHHRAGRLAEAEAIYRRILAKQPDHAGALHLLGVIAHQAGRHAASSQLIRRAIDLNPGVPDFHSNLGNALHSNGDPDGAAAAYRRAIEIKPNYAEAYSNLGLVLRDLGRISESIAMQRRALALDPTFVTAESALGLAHVDDGDHTAALAAYRRALAINPQNADVYNNLGSALQDLGHLSDAEVAYRKAIEFAPNSVAAYSNLAIILKDTGRVDESYRTARHVLERQPDYAPAHSNYVFSMHYEGRFSPADILAESKRWAARHAAGLAATPIRHDNPPDPERRLRIGYVSPDLYTHSVSFFFEALLAARDPAKVETICYADGPRRDHTSERLQGLADIWRDLRGVSDDRFAAMVRADKVDILVDLAGHTARNRLLALARKPAPLQVSYLGYCGTTGLPEIDYRLTDGVADPGASDAHFTEQLVRLPRCFLCYAPEVSAPPVAPLAARKAGHVTFASFNNLAKVTAEVMALWAAVLDAVPDSRLLIKARALDDPKVQNTYAKRLAAAGVPVERLILAAPIRPLQEHLGFYGRVDIALDSFPYNGTTTTCEALWMGVPVIALAGRAHAGRVSTSLLSAVGLDELVAQTPADYVAKAAALATDLDRLEAMRAGLRDRMAASPLCDQAGLARAVEDAYRTMWRRWCEAR